ncbi:TrmH family RNA methyltransferase [Parasediminibacterium paludis]|uniref:tRNA (guanosine(18)-2'-O)-methyltransferase n=1 Tax=Parasediminibacterium paludis TaxID=908966 RepID=A0ABV8Q112_9BACT
MTPERSEKLLKVLSQRQTNLTVVLENVQDPRNITAVMRTCEAVGIQDIFIINTKQPRFEKFGFKSGSSSSKWLTIHQFDSIADCFKELRTKFEVILTTHLSAKAIDLYSIDFTQSIALVFGNEHSGVSDEANDLADGNFIIPQMGIIQSLNISVACAVSIYEAYRQKTNAGHYQQSSMPEPQMRALRKQWGFDKNT